MRAKTWAYRANSLPQFHTGTILLTEEPLWLSVVGWLIDNLASRACGLLHWIALPNFIRIKDGEETYGLGEYYGDVGDLWFNFVYVRMEVWHHKHPKRRNIKVEIGYDRLRELLGAVDPTYFSQERDLTAEMSQDLEGARG